MKATNRGGVLIEALVSLELVLLPTIGVHMEIIRLVQMHGLLHRMACVYVRNRALGESDALSRSRAWQIAGLGLRPSELRRLHRSLRWEYQIKSARGAVGRLVLRYPGLFPSFHDRFQVTKTCPFYF